jgi:hypothetical protein
VNVGHSQLSGANNSWFEKITSPWDENLVTWNNQPATDTLHRAYLHPSITYNEDYVVNVTALIQDIVSYPVDNYGLMLRLDTESYYRSLVFCSSDYPDETKHPRLDICYTLPTNVAQNERGKNFSASISPNPFHTTATITISDFGFWISDWQLKIFDVFGRCIQEQIIRKPKTEIRNNGMGSGIYFYQLTNDTEQLVNGKFFVE